MARTSRVEDRREGLLAAAIEVFLQHGYNAAKVSDIVAAAGVAQGTFYLYFRSKTAIFQTLIERFVSHFLTIIETDDVTAITTTEECLARQRAVFRSVLQVCYEHRELARLFFREALAADPEFHQLLHDLLSQIAQIVRRNLASGIANGFIRPLDPEIAAYAIVGMCEMVIRQRLVLTDGPVDLDALTEELLALQLRGVLSQPVGKPEGGGNETTSG